jgi:hypothetical protein
VPRVCAGCGERDPVTRPEIGGPVHVLPDGEALIVCGAVRDEAAGTPATPQDEADG